MGNKENLIALENAPSTIAVDEKLTGLQWMKKVFTPNGGSAAFLSESKLDLDTDGVEQPGIDYSTDPDHQSQTSMDPSGTWLNSNTVNYFVLPGGFSTRHGGIELGCLATVLYGGNIGHAIYADAGPTTKFGEGSLSLQRALGFELVQNGAIVNSGIDNDVWILIYIGSNIGKTPCTQADIDAAAAPLWAAFTG